MNFVKIVSIIRPEALEKVEMALKSMNVPGVSITNIQGYGEYANFFRHDRMVQHIQVEIFIGKRQATEIAEKIMEVAHSGIEGDGIVAIIPVESVYHIRTRQKCGDEVC
ncbi:MAG: P-II family nitrogen regulator [Gammaproteobacteria bacterium]|nr:P-II family nitrogen regulator [Gammaproteobacteria bacterium]MCW8986697.1 P-II family nitrogen regulator [Gammaproteobacteria bacterium]MCW9029980.1 P-II family nitrogen regulator [Gammaproteobacteria bacterium]